MYLPILAIVVGGVATREGIQQAIELNERHQVFKQARNYADSLGKPLLVVGTPKFRMTHPCGDVTIDLDPKLPKICNYEVADIRDIPYPSGYFGAAFASHILEHLPTIEDACQALDELERVSNKVFVASPHKSSIIAFIHPGHHLWITPSGDGYIIEQRGYPKITPREKAYVISLSVV